LELLNTKSGNFNGVLASGAIAATTHEAGAVTATAATLGELTATTLTAQALIANGASLTPAAVEVTADLYVVPSSFSSNGTIVIAVNATTLNITLPDGASLPSGYTLSVLNLSATGVVVAPTITLQKPAILSVTGATGASFVAPAVSLTCFVWLGPSTWLTY
jgi:hypothetical protein